MVKAEVDMPKLLRSLKRASKAFGETTSQAIARWGVQTCRELAKETQVWGKTKGKASGEGFPWAKGKQEGAMVADALNVLTIKDNIGPRNKKALRSADEVYDWIEMNRTARRGRTAKLPIEERKVCNEATFKAAMRKRFKLAGMAKGGWLGAGADIAKKQTGNGRIPFSNRYISYAQKHSKLGSATLAKRGFSPFAKLENRARHSASSSVLGKKQRATAIAWGARATIKWYNKAAKAALDKS